jgi:hypothetical protein
MEEELTQTIGSGGPQVLIVHTHGSEAYNPTAEGCLRGLGPLPYDGYEI